MSKIVATPEPPYYAVIAPAVVSRDAGGFAEQAQRLLEAAREIDGFLGIETCVQGRFLLAVSYWRSLDAIDTWRRHAEHAVAKRRGMAQWFDAYFTRIARVERDY
jgi:heme-degrading monooxygenase HmoA